jgi:RNA polymerase sigma-70 factor (ECF subfamily)
MNERASVRTIGDQLAGASSWSALMARAQAGDRLAYSTLLEQLIPYLRSMSWRCLRTSEEVEDSVQDILLTVHVIRHTYDPRRPFAPWIAAVAKRRIVDRLRRRSRREGREVLLSAHPEALQVAAPDGVDLGPDFATLRQAVGALPLSQRRAIELLRFRELSLREATAESEFTSAALKVALHRALKSLRQALRPSKVVP